MPPADEIVFGTGGLRSPGVFEEAWRAGYRVFDTAVYYANDGELAAALDACGAGEQARLVHKVQPHRVSEQFERLIRPRLGGRRLDTLLLHHPALFVLRARPDALMKPWGELERLVGRGLVRRIGLSNAGPDTAPVFVWPAVAAGAMPSVPATSAAVNSNAVQSFDLRPEITILPISVGNNHDRAPGTWE